MDGDKQMEKTHNRQVLTRNDTLNLFIDRVQDYAIFLMNPEGEIATWNIGAERIKGYSAKEIIGKHFSVFYPDEETEKAAQLLEIAYKEGRVEDVGWRVRKDGSKFWADVVITSIFDSEGTHLGYGKVTKDLTEQVNMERLKRSYDEVEAMVRDVSELNAELRESNSKLVGREYRIRELENEVRLLKLRLDISD
jgi:PAS domain S-box-containing protein